MDEGMKVFVNEEFHNANEAKISVFDRSFLYGDGVFEGIRVYDDRVFKLDDHLNRLLKSAKSIKINMNYSIDDLKGFIVETLRQNPSTVTYLRPIITRGHGPLGIENTGDVEGPSIIIIPQERPPKQSKDGRGLKIETISRRQIPFEYIDSRVKLNHYINNILGKLELSDGVDDGLMLSKDGYVTELTARNIFIVKEGKVYTPKPHNILNGITRQTVIEILNSNDIPICEDNITPYDLYNSDEIFVTSTMTEIAWVQYFNGEKISSDLGPITNKVIEEYNELVRSTGHVWVD